MSIRTRLLLALTVLTCLALPATPALAQADLPNCDDPSLTEDVIRANPNEYDADDDGTACEDTINELVLVATDPTPAATTTPTPGTPDVTPAPQVQAPSRIDAGGGGTAGRDGSDPILAGGIALAGLAALAVTRRRRARG